MDSRFRGNDVGLVLLTIVQMTPLPGHGKFVGQELFFHRDSFHRLFPF